MTISRGFDRFSDQAKRFCDFHRDSGPWLAEVADGEEIASDDLVYLADELDRALQCEDQPHGVDLSRVRSGAARVRVMGQHYEAVFSILVTLRGLRAEGVGADTVHSAAREAVARFAYGG